MDSLSIGQARRLALGAQGFRGSRPSGRLDRRHLRKTMDTLQVVQLDSVPAVMRTQYLPFFSRLGPYRPGLLDDIAYRDDTWFEAWAHEASLLPVASEPLFRWAKQRCSEGQTWKGLVRLAREEPTYVQSVLDEVTERGPLFAKELRDPRPREGAWWGSRSVGQLALDWLFRIGAVGVRRVGNFEKQFDRLERIVPEEVRALPTPSVEEAQRELLRRSAKALGVGTADDLVDYFRLPVREAKRRVAELVDAGDLVEVDVEGWSKPAYCLPDAKVPRRIDRIALISPFDPVVWNRDRAERLFGFRYRIEIYVPADKREYGYYVLPLLVGDRLVARFDLKTLRDERVLHVKGAFAEPGVDVAELGPRAREELQRLATFVGADALRIEPRGNLAAALR
ncbi:MAG: crosslink repair DNA glycosylase YcaQ family protein [Bacteroidota bacterium]